MNVIHRSREWAGGRFTMPFEIEGTQPLVALWVELPAGIVVGADIQSPGDRAGWFARTLRKAMKKPAAGKARRPARIRVAEAELAAELRKAYGDIEIVVGPTPEVDEAFESLATAMGGKEEPVRETQATGTERYHALDRRLLDEVIGFGSERFGRRMLPESLLQIPEEGFPLALQWAAYDLPVDGKPLADRYFERCKLDAAERAWIEAQRRAWLSIWEVLSVAAGKEVALRDLLTGQVRTVQERKASQSLRARDVILARVVDHEGVSLFCGMYARSLPPYEAADVLRDVRGKLRKKEGDVPVDRLRGKSVGRFMIEHWADAVDELDERRLTPPTLTNTDGELVAFVTDRFTFDVVNRKAVEERLSALDDAGEAIREDGETIIDLRRDETVIATLFIGEGILRVETNSEGRAVAIRRRIIEACGDLIRHRSLEQRDPSTFGGGEPAPPYEPTPEEEALVRQYKESYYRKWMDEPVPMLGNKTPRQASRSRKGRAELDLLLRHIENGEASQPEGSRFDVSMLRSELGL